MNSKEILLDISNISKTYKRGEPLSALNQISLQIFKGETLGLIGESGCGKTTLGRCLLRLINPTQGKILYRGEIIYDDSRRKNAIPSTLRKNMQIVFQNPQLSLDPRMTVKEILREPLRIHKICPTREREDEAICNLLQTVELNTSYLHKYPFELSGGEQQRLIIARALSVSPEFIVLDEPVSSLDLILQSQIINLLKKIQAERKTTFLFISHDFAAVNAIAHRIAVMHMGRIVEIATTDELNQMPLHPYTKQLLFSVPHINIHRTFREQDLSHLLNLSPQTPTSNAGCPWTNFCVYATDICKHSPPVLHEAYNNHYVSCHNTQRFFN